MIRPSLEFGKLRPEDGRLTLSVMELHQGKGLLGAAHKIWKTNSPNLEATMQVLEWFYKENSVKVIK